MNRDGVGERDFVEFTKIANHLALIEPDDNFALDRINLHDLADVAVEHVLVRMALLLSPTGEDRLLTGREPTN